jgi:hypothetical protein
VVPLFAGERPLRAAAGRVDWRLCGPTLAPARRRAALGRDRRGGADPGRGRHGRAPRARLGAGERAQIDPVAWDAWLADALARAARSRRSAR